jgi:hypothetical protein
MPLIPQDELLCHQLTTTFDHVLQSDLRWTERIVLYGYDTATGISLMTGLARYANRNIMDAYAMVTTSEKAHVSRFSRELDSQHDGIADWSVGPYTYRIEEPLRAVSATLAGPDQPITLDIRLDGTFDAYEQTPAFHRSRGRIKEDARRYYQNGTVTGSFEYDGQRVEINPETWWFGRDHSWGTRQGGGGGSLSEGDSLQPTEIPEGVLYVMGIFEFEDEIVHFAQREDARGNVWQFEGEVLGSGLNAPQRPPVSHVEHDLTFRIGASGSRLVETGEFVVHQRDGSSRKLTVQAKHDFWPGLAGYDTFRGYGSGMWKGKSWSDNFVADLSNAEDMRQVGMLTETFVEVRDGDRIGHGLVESVFLGAYPRYGYTGW